MNSARCLPDKTNQIVSFNKQLRVILIPSLVEYKLAGLRDVLWYSPNDYFSFSREAATEIMEIVRHEGVDIIKAKEILYQSQTSRDQPAFDSFDCECTSYCDCNTWLKKHYQRMQQEEQKRDENSSNNNNSDIDYDSSGSDVESESTGSNDGNVMRWGNGRRRRSKVIIGFGDDEEVNDNDYENDTVSNNSGNSRSSNITTSEDFVRLSPLRGRMIAKHKSNRHSRANSANSLSGSTTSSEDTDNSTENGSTSEKSEETTSFLPL